MVERSKADGIFNATTGVGVLREDVNVAGAYAQPCDVVPQKAYISVRPSEIIADERCFMQIHTHMGRRHMVDRAGRRSPAAHLLTSAAWLRLAPDINNGVSRF